MIQLVCVGKIKEQWLRDGIREYEKRLTKHCRLEVIELKDEPVASDAEKAKKIEGRRILDALKNRYAVALDSKGKQFSSEEFSAFIKKAGIEQQNTAFVIGGATGLSDEVLNRCNEKISFSRMTFPHQLMRLIFLEQLYRAFEINAGTAYHK